MEQIHTHVVEPERNRESGSRRRERSGLLSPIWVGSKAKRVELKDAAKAVVAKVLAAHPESVPPNVPKCPC